jgi:hypothetical protein
MKKILLAGMLVAAAAVTPAQAKSGVKIGVLSCVVDGGVGYIIASAKAVDCTFRSGSRVEHYHGVIRKFGVDIGITDKTSIAWAVFAPGSVKRGALKGVYTGATAEATAIAGLGANVLIGGFRKGINLQPLSVQAQTGLNVAAGIGSLSLKYDR